MPGDIFVSDQLDDGAFGPATAVAELDDATANDTQSNVRKDGREIVFSSNRAGGLGAQDGHLVSTRESENDPWTTPSDLGDAVNSSAAETRPSLSWGAQELLYARAPGSEGMSDIYLAT